MKVCAILGKNTEYAEYAKPYRIWFCDSSFTLLTENWHLSDVRRREVLTLSLELVCQPCLTEQRILVKNGNVATK